MVGLIEFRAISELSIMIIKRPKFPTYPKLNILNYKNNYTYT